MTIKQLILEFLRDIGKAATMNDIDKAVWPKSSGFYATFPSTIRARVYELLKEGKVVRVARGTYALPKPIKKAKRTLHALEHE